MEAEPILVLTRRGGTSFLRTCISCIQSNPQTVPAFNRTCRQYLRHLPSVPASPANATGESTNAVYRVVVAAAALTLSATECGWTAGCQSVVGAGVAFACNAPRRAGTVKNYLGDAPQTVAEQPESASPADAEKTCDARRSEQCPGKENAE